MKHRGSVLIEQILAIALLSVVVVSLFSLLATGSMAGQLAQELSLAGALAAQKLEETLASREEPTEVPRQLLDPRRFPGYEWQVTVTEVAPALQQVTVTVWWLRRGYQRSVSLTTLVRWQEDR